MKLNPWQERLALECTDEAYERFLAVLKRNSPQPTTVVNTSRNQAYDILITRPSCWGNPFHIGIDGTRQQVIDKYEEHVRADPAFVAKIKAELKGKRLGCCCKPKACHGDVLARIADEED